ncbi:Uncharacterized membrane protein YdjX, TVP38/TMEM64 family, SNARE-associated domain [Paenibacillus sp. UNCCL117]|uniref:TVP38/TMEM64 family protein n=1 Tax=unclassified Paenibacillus TaxID=185978 RepID=UPI0008894903|nr:MULTISPECIES: VTT domain-containing protein [unclassified Paenibacillus]SDC17688.1 Uncharacterized membrane protein YdjX, TVP38/TMEM64 family, SNARE-associated domain [Paenibacillus sp. cl123]SFW18057.1 Uncharacterized membrane protein YdjX, TVP38/TMEM64 family, SNARE-associated domain [Paenibacillus sp. UNCCL117]
MKIGLVVLTYAAMLGAAYVYKGELLGWLERDGGGAEIPLMLLLSLLFALVPVIPFGVIGGVLGAKYGILVGSLLNVAGSSLAAVIMLLTVRYLFSQQGRRYLARFRRVEAFTELYERRPFLSVLAARLIPVMPAPAVNVYSALTRISLPAFAAATLLGKIPVMLVFAVVGDTVLSDPALTAKALLIYAAFLAAVFIGYKLLLKQSASRPASREAAGARELE